MKRNFTKLLILLATILGHTALQAQCTFTGLNPNYCTNSPSSTLTPGTPGGNFTGPGISTNVFNPGVAGPGTHTINYNICQLTYSMNSITYAPSASVGVNVGASDFTNSDDGETASLPIGFTFQYFCTPYTNFYISTNGFIEFALTGNGCCSGQAIPNTSTPNNLVAWCWTDLYPGNGGSTTYTTLGTSPNRTLVVTFLNIPFFSGGGTASAQIKLMEGTNIIEIHSNNITGNTTSIRTQGIENQAGTAGYPVTGRSASTFTAVSDAYRFIPGASCAASQTTIVSPSTISIVGSASICSGATTTLTATGNTTYSWNVGSNNPSISVSPTVNTTYAVVATNSFNCIANSAITVTVDNSPTITVVSSSPGSGVCPGSTVALTGSGATTYSWTGSVTNGTPFTIGGQSTYTVTGFNACGSATAAVSLSVHPLPTVSGVASQPTICSGNPVSLTGVGSAITFTWNGGAIPNGSNFFPSSTAIYTLVGTSALGCTNTAQTGVTVVTTPANPPQASPPLICIGSSASLTSTGATAYTWTGPSGSQSGSLIVVSPSANTTYTLVKSNANCINTQTIQLYVNQLPTVFAIVTPTLMCASRSATLQAGGAQSYTWFAAGPPVYTVTGASPVVSPSVSTLYTVSASDGTCVNTTTVYLATNPNPTINIVATSTSICQGDQVSLTANGAIGYSWTTVGVVSNTNAASITESPIVATLYQVTGINNFNCTSNQQQVVLVRTTPTISIGTTKPLVCKGAPSTLTATSQGGSCTYVWDANAGSVTNSIAIVNPLVSTSYTVVGLAVNGCTASQSYPVSVFLPTFAVNSPTSSCQGGTITLTASGANTYTWNGNQPFSSIQVSPPSATVYVVAATSNSSGVNCVSTNTVIVSIYTNPTVTAVATRTQICKFETTTVKGQGAVGYTWNTSQTGSLVPVNPNLNTTYTVTGTDQNGCIGTATVLVKVSTCFGIEELNKISGLGLSIYPNPNHGVFNVRSDVDLQLNLMNELGQIVKVIDLSADNAHQVEISGLANGIYFLAGKKDDRVLMEKIIVHQ